MSPALACSADLAANREHAAALAALVSGGTAQAAKRLDLNNPVDALAASRKVQCSLKDGEPVVYHWSGHIYSRVPGEPDRNLFNLEGMNIRACITVKDPVKGDGYRMVSRELMFYTDPKTGEALDIVSAYQVAGHPDPAHQIGRAHV